MTKNFRRTGRQTCQLGLLLLTGLLAACSFSSGGSGGSSSPSKTYVVLPSGQAVPAQTADKPPGY